jgi:hypothetical protein
MESEEEEWSPLPSGTEGSLSSDDDDAWVDDADPTPDAASPATAPPSSAPRDAPTELSPAQRAEPEPEAAWAADQAPNPAVCATATPSSGQTVEAEAEAEAEVEAEAEIESEAEMVADDPSEEPHERGFDDYTLASPWERFVAGVEAVLRKWFDTDAATLCARAEPSQYAALSLLTRVDLARTTPLPHCPSPPVHRGKPQGGHLAVHADGDREAHPAVAQGAVLRDAAPTAYPRRRRRAAGALGLQVRAVAPHPPLQLQLVSSVLSYVFRLHSRRTHSLGDTVPIITRAITSSCATYSSKSDDDG